MMVVVGNEDAEQYIQILNDGLLGTLKKYRMDSDDIIFQHDGASSHTALKVKDWFEDNNIETMPWPGQSPDLNCIENMTARILEAKKRQEE